MRAVAAPVQQPAPSSPQDSQLDSKAAAAEQLTKARQASRLTSVFSALSSSRELASQLWSGVLKFMETQSGAGGHSEAATSLVKDTVERAKEVRFGVVAAQARFH